MNSRLLTLADNVEIVTAVPRIYNFEVTELLGGAIDMRQNLLGGKGTDADTIWGGGHPIPVTIRVRTVPVYDQEQATLTFGLFTSDTGTAGDDIVFARTVGSGPTQTTLYFGYMLACGTWHVNEFDYVGKELSFYVPTQMQTQDYIQLGVLGSRTPQSRMRISAWIGGPDTSNWTAFPEGYR